MNMKNRLQKLENATNVSSEYCRHFGLQTEVEVRSADAKELKASAIPDFCEKCRKPIRSERIIIQGV